MHICSVRTRRRERGFTLVELLVVIGIIALLISILMPALSKAREMSKRTVCLSNLHQLHLASLMYANDNKGWFPFRPLPSATTAGAWWPPQVWYIGGRTDCREMWLSYLGNYSVDRSSPSFYCPSSDGDLVHTPQGGWPYQGNIYLVGYPYFGNYPTGTPPGDWPRWISKTDPPRKVSDRGNKPLFADIIEDYQVNAPGFNYINHGPHGGSQFSLTPPVGMNCVLSDGSATWYPWSNDLTTSSLEVNIESGGGGSNSGFFAPRVSN